MFIYSYFRTYLQGRSQDFISGVEHFKGPASWGVRGAESPGRRKKFESLKRFSLKNCKKCIIFAYFPLNFTNLALFFRALGRNTQIAWKVEKFSTGFLKKIAKTALFFPILHKTLQTLR